MSVIASLRERWSWLDHLVGIQERFGAIGGGPRSSSLGLAGFLSLFPLMIVAVAVIGFISSGDADFTTKLIDDIGLEGKAADLLTDSVESAEASRRAASIVGFLGLLWAGLGVVAALQAAVNAAWQTTGRGLVDKAVGLAWLVGAGTLFIAVTSIGPLLRLVPGPAALAVVAGMAASVAATTAIMIWAYGFLGNQSLSWRAHLTGAVVVAIGMEVLELVGTYYVPRAVASSSAVYGTIGVVFALLAFLLLYARLFVYGAVINVYLWEQHRGTVTVEAEVPRMEGQVALTATRGGAVLDKRD